jgi:hypothetical protein
VGREILMKTPSASGPVIGFLFVAAALAILLLV